MCILFCLLSLSPECFARIHGRDNVEKEIEVNKQTTQKLITSCPVVPCVAVLNLNFFSSSSSMNWKTEKLSEIDKNSVWVEHVKKENLTLLAQPPPNFAINPRSSLSLSLFIHLSLSISIYLSLSVSFSQYLLLPATSSVCPTLLPLLSLSFVRVSVSESLLTAHTPI